MKTITTIALMFLASLALAAPDRAPMFAPELQPEPVVFPWTSANGYTVNVSPDGFTLTICAQSYAGIGERHSDGKYLVYWFFCQEEQPGWIGLYAVEPGRVHGVYQRANEEKPTTYQDEYRRRQ